MEVRCICRKRFTIATFVRHEDAINPGNAVYQVSGKAQMQQKLDSSTFVGVLISKSPEYFYSEQYKIDKAQILHCQGFDVSVPAHSCHKLHLGG